MSADAGQTTISNSRMGADAGQTEICNKKYRFCARFLPRITVLHAILKLVLQNTCVFVTVGPGKVGADADKTTMRNSRASADAGQTKVCNEK